METSSMTLRAMFGSFVPRRDARRPSRQRVGGIRMSGMRLARMHHLTMASKPSRSSLPDKFSIVSVPIYLLQKTYYTGRGLLRIEAAVVEYLLL